MADEMGLVRQFDSCYHRGGKTCQYPDIVICPASVVPVWIKESKERFPKIKTKFSTKNLISQKNQRIFYGLQVIHNYDAIDTVRENKI